MVSVPASDAPASGPIQVGEWVVDPATNELRRGDEATRIEPKSMDVLRVLAERAGRVVTREELFGAVWPGLVVGDEALSQSITKLRRAPGGDPRSPRYIETISKRGYRLTATVVRDAPANPQAAGASVRRAGATAVALLVLAAAGWFLLAPAVAPTAGEETADREEAWTTVSVTPFDWIGGDASQAYLARGIGEALATDLGRLGELRLIGAGGAAPADAARQARYVVSGSVQRDADTLRVNVRLADTRTGEQLWSERFERPVAELFAIQDDIIGRVAASLPAKVSESRKKRLAARHTQSIEAYDLFLRAQALVLARGAKENLEARELYRKAIAIDPRFARAYAALSMTHAIETRLDGTPPSAAALDRAPALAESAREIDPAIAEVQWALGFVHTQARRYPQALGALGRAIELNPSFADAHARMGGIHTYLGEPRKSIPLLRTAMRLEPGAGYLYFLLLGRAYFFEGDIEQALINLRAALERNAADLETRIYLAAALAASGNRAAAEWEAEEIRALARDFSPARWLATYPLASAPHREKLRGLLEPLYTVPPATLAR